MKRHQRVAIENTCLIAEETSHPRFGHRLSRGSLVFTVNTGYE